jgi:hypothetical protein
MKLWYDTAATVFGQGKDAMNSEPFRGENQPDPEKGTLGFALLPDVQYPRENAAIPRPALNGLLESCFPAEYV